MFLPFPALWRPVRWAVRRRALVCDIRADVLLLHSMLSPAAYRVLATDGVLRCDRAHADPAFHDAYQWLIEQACHRVPGYGGGYPIWFWAQTNRRDLLCNVRQMARCTPGSVLVTCRMPRSHCLLSAYDDWHAVLNASPLVPWSAEADTEDEDAWAAWSARLGDEYDKRDRALERAGVPRNGPFRAWPADLRAEIGRTWEHVFDLDAYPIDEYWQATVEELHAADVVDSCVTRVASR